MKAGQKARGRAGRTAGKKPKIAGNASSKKLQQTQAASTAMPTDEQIAQRAEHIWRQGGCLPGRDEQNWHEAEAQLKAELHVN